MEKLLVIEWEIHDTRDLNGGYFTGTSKLQVKAKNNTEAINAAIDFARHLPDWELERNNIDIEQYRKAPKLCSYCYQTQLSKVLSITNIK